MVKRDILLLTWCIIPIRPLDFALDLSYPVPPRPRLHLVFHLPVVTDLLTFFSCPRLYLSSEVRSIDRVIRYILLLPSCHSFLLSSSLLSLCIAPRSFSCLPRRLPVFLCAQQDIDRPAFAKTQPPHLFPDEAPYNFDII